MAECYINRCRQLNGGIGIRDSQRSFNKTSHLRVIVHTPTVTLSEELHDRLHNPEETDFTNIVSPSHYTKSEQQQASQGEIRV